MVDRLRRIKQKVNFPRTMSNTNEQALKDNIYSAAMVESEEPKKKIFSLKKGRDFFEDLKSYYKLKKRKLINNIHETQTFYLSTDKNKHLSAEEQKTKLENNKKKWKRNTKKFNIFLFILLSSYIIYKKYYKRAFLTFRITRMIFGVGVISIMSNVYLQTKINDHYKYKFKEISKDVNKL